jgi:hypothetical protein
MIDPEERVRPLIPDDDPFEDDWHSPIRDACDLHALKSHGIGHPKGGYVILDKLVPPSRKAVQDTLTGGQGTDT